jgi:hypothetical protein
MDKLAPYFIGERVCFVGAKGGLWGEVTEVKKHSVTIMTDEGRPFVAKYGGGHFGLVRHGANVFGKVYNDPKRGKQ